MEKNNLEIRINVQARDLDKEQIDELVYHLKSDLENFPIEVKKVVNTNEDTSGKKGDPFTIGALIIVLSPIALKAIFDFIQNWISQTRNISIEVPNGTKIEFSTDKKYSEKELLKLIKKINKIK